MFCTGPTSAATLQIILKLCIPEKELAKTRSQIAFIYFQIVHNILSGTTRSQKNYENQI
jgi:hypothetical protein